MARRLRTYDELAAQVLFSPGPVRLVGVDGCGGAGKTTFASRLAAACGDAPVVHTDDFATHETPTEWWPLMLAAVIEPLRRDEPASFHPYDWVARRRSDAPIVVAPATVVIIEGVGATRAAWREALALRVWVEAPRELRLARGLARDGEELREFWREWMQAEDRYVAAESPKRFADVVVDGAPAAAHDAMSEFVAIELSERR